MKTSDKKIIDSLIKNKPGNGNVDDSSEQTKDYIIMIVDRSGSMQSMVNDAQGGINAFINANKEAGGNAIFTLVEFDYEYNVVYNKAPIEEVGQYKLNPRGSTALFDTIGWAVSDSDSVDVSGSKLVVIVTDGEENASREWTREKIFDKIEKMKSDGWEFIFLAANQDAIKSGSSIGIDGRTSLNFTPETAREAYAAATAYAVSYRVSDGDAETRVRSARESFNRTVRSSEVLSSINTDKT